MAETTSLFTHEQQAIDEIKRHFAGKKLYRVLNNLLIHDTQSNYYYEYDLVIVSPTNVYVIDLKHWSGRIEIASNNWRINGRTYRRDPHASNTYKCKVLKGLYQHQFPTYPGMWIESVIVLTHPDAIVEGADSPKDAADAEKRNPTFASISDFIRYVNRRSSKREVTKALVDYQIEAVAALLESLGKPRNGTPDVILGYEIVDTLGVTPAAIELLGRHAEGHIRGLKRFRIFGAPARYVAEERERYLRRSYNALKSVSKIGDHSNILQVQVLEDQDLGVVELSDWSDIGTLRDYLEMTNKRPDKETALSICRGILSALCRAHEVDVIHRAVKPENVLLANEHPKLMNFDLAYIVEDKRLTVIEDPTSLKDDGYVAPEILLGEDIDESTDFFGLAVIAYEMFVGERPFKTVQEYVSRGGKLSDVERDRLADSRVSQILVDTIAGMLVGDRKKRTKDLGSILTAFGMQGVEKDKGVRQVDEVLAPGSTHDLYEIGEFIARGREAQVYKGKTLDRTVAIKIYNSDVPRERSLQELSITSSINSSYVVRSEYFGHWRNERFFLVMDYIEGESMRSFIEKGVRPSLEDFRSVALCLMEAVAAFHDHTDDEGTRSPWLHCDIKPDNVIITSDKKPVLIDCTLAGEPRIELLQGTRDYIPPDSILGSDVQLTESSDLYGLGITLWEWMFGRLPYERASIGATPDCPPEMASFPEDLQKWFQKAVATEAHVRFKEISEMKAEFTTRRKNEEEKEDTESQPEESLPTRHSGGQDVYVAYLNTLANNSPGNENATAEHQVLNDHFQRIHVDNPVSAIIYEKLIGERQNVVLTGNAGDGKTTIAIDVFMKVMNETRALEPVERLPSAGLVIVKDMSELSREQQVEVLSEARYSDDVVYLIVTNTGTFLESFTRVFQGEKVESSLLNALKAETPQLLFDDRFFLINLGRIDSIDTACKVLRRMVDAGNWVKCLDCDDPEHCPLYTNVQLILERKDIFFERLELLYRRLFEYGTRLTMRHMTGHLAYTLTGGLDCYRVRKRSLIGAQHNLSHELFFNRFFGDDGKNPLGEAQQLYAIRKIREIGLGTVLDSKFERMTWLKNTSNESKGEESCHQRVRRILTRKNSVVNRRQMRRYSFFFEPFEDEQDRDRFIAAFLRSELLTEYVKYCSRKEELRARDESIYRRQIIHVLQEFFTGLRFPEGSYSENSIYITLNRETSASNTQMVLADFKVDDFRLAVKPKYQVGRNFSGVLSLNYLRADPKQETDLELDLPFLDYVTRRYRGEVAEELSAFYADRLERFKVRLLTEHENHKVHDRGNGLKILVMGKGRKIELRHLLIDDGRLEVL